MRHATEVWLDEATEEVMIPNRIITGADGEPYELHPAIATWRNRVMAEREQKRIDEDIDPWIDCVDCRDTGWMWEANKDGKIVQSRNPCWCDPGTRLAKKLAADKAWAEMLPPRYEHYSLNTCPNDGLVIRMWDWMKLDPLKTGNGIVLCGDVGRGKTGAAIGAMRYFHEQGASVRFQSVQELLSTLKETFDGKEQVPDTNKPMARAKRAGVLVLDDLGAERMTDFSVDTIDELIRHRYEHMRPTVITSNLTKPAFERHIGPKLWSRVVQTCVVVPAEGPDYRIEKGV